MKRPDFFFIGAPKCGTTAIANWLRDHPAVFLTHKPKEPMFFDTDLHNPDRMSLSTYEKLFARADESHLAIGEASTTYLRSRVAVNAILDYSPSARFLVALRNPVDMAQSVHAQLLFTQYEVVEDFQQAWYLQDSRRAGRHLPANCLDDPGRLMYSEICSIGRQLERLLQHVPDDRVKIILMDDIKADPRAVYRDTLRFLGVPDDGKSDFPAANTRKRIRSPLLGRLIWMAHKVKKLTGLQGVSTGMMRGLHSWNQVAANPPSLNEAFRQELVDYFAEDIRLITDLTGRDLSAWMR